MGFLGQGGGGLGARGRQRHKRYVVFGPCGAQGWGRGWGQGLAKAKTN